MNTLDDEQDDSLHILLFCYEYPPLGGGGGVGAKNYAESWAAMGHRVTVVTSRQGDLAAVEEIGGVRVVRVGIVGKMHRATSTVLSMASYLISGTLHLLTHGSRYRNADVINTHFSLPTGPLGWTAARLLDVPNILTIIGGDIYDPTKWASPHRHSALRVLNRFLIQSAAKVVAISSDTRSRALRHYRIDRPVEVVNYGFRPPARDDVANVQLDPTSQRYHLISVGRLVPRKGFDYLIRAMADLPQDVHLLLIGDGPLEAALKDLARSLGVFRRVHFLGYEPSARVFGYLEAADCFVLSSLHEGLGIVVQEAMWAGLPIISTDNGGQVDLLEDGRNALLVPAGDREALSEAVHSLYTDEEAAARMSRFNRTDIRDHSLEHSARRYLEIFSGLVNDEPDRWGSGRADPVSQDSSLSFSRSCFSIKRYRVVRSTSARRAASEMFPSVFWTSAVR